MYTAVTDNSLCFGGFRALEAGHTAGAVFNPVNNDVGVSRAFRARARLDAAVFSPSRRHRARAAYRHSPRYSVRALVRLPPAEMTPTERDSRIRPDGRFRRQVFLQYASRSRGLPNVALSVRIPSVVLYGLFFFFFLSTANAFSLQMSINGVSTLTTAIIYT